MRKEGLETNTGKKEPVIKEISDTSLTHLEKTEKRFQSSCNRDESERQLYWNIKPDVNSIEFKIFSFQSYKGLISQVHLSEEFYKGSGLERSEMEELFCGKCSPCGD